MNSESFRRAAKEAYEKTQYGQQKKERFFSVDKQGNTSPVEPVDNGESQPSTVDVESAKHARPLYVVSRGGLYMVRPSDGKIIHVFENADWVTKKPQEPKKKE